MTTGRIVPSSALSAVARTTRSVVSCRFFAAPISPRTSSRSRWPIVPDAVSIGSDSREGSSSGSLTVWPLTRRSLWSRAVRPLLGPACSSARAARPVVTGAIRPSVRAPRQDRPNGHGSLTRSGAMRRDSARPGEDRRTADRAGVISDRDPVADDAGVNGFSTSLRTAVGRSTVRPR